MISWFAQSLVYGVRRRLRDRWFSAAIVVLVALAAGTSTAVYTVLDTAVIQAMPFPGADELFVVQCKSEVALGGCPVSLADEVRTRSQQVDEVAYYSFGPITMERGKRSPLIVGTKKVSSSFFTTLGIRPSVGRWFLASDNSSSRNQVILSEATRQKLFDQGENPIGGNILMDGVPYDVVGVMPSVFAFPDSKIGAWVLDPLTVTQFERAAAASANLFLRAKNGVTAKALETELNGLALPLSTPMDGPKGLSAKVLTMQSVVVGFDSKLLWLLFWGTLCLVAIVCANVSGLLVSRSRLISYNHAVQVALGASRWRPRIEAVNEYLLLAVPAAILGLAIARGGLGVFESLGALNLSRAELAAIGMRSALYCGGISVLAFLIASVAAVLLAGSPSSLNVRRLETAHAARFAGLRLWVLQRIALVAQLSLAALLAVVAVSAACLLWKVWNIPLGFEPHGLMAVPVRDYPRDSVATAHAYTSRLAQDVLSVPGVSAAGFASAAPLTGGITIPRLPYVADDGSWKSVPKVAKSTVSDNYLTLLGAKLIAGRQFGETDATTTPCVAIVNRLAASAMGGVDGVVNRTVSTTMSEGDAASRCTVVGVIEDIRQVGMMSDVRPEVFYLDRQRLDLRRTLIVRLAPDMRQPPEALRTLLADRLGGQSKVAFLDVFEYVTKGTQKDRLLAYSILFFAFGGCLVAVAGIVGSAVSQLADRRQEFAIRLALGGQRSDLVKHVLRGSGTLSAIGISVGVIGAYAVGRVYQSWDRELVPMSSTGHLVVALAGCAVVIGLATLPVLRTRMDNLSSVMRGDG